MRKKDMIKRIKKLEHIIELQEDLIEYQHKAILDLAAQMQKNDIKAGYYRLKDHFIDLDFPNDHK